MRGLATDASASAEIPEAFRDVIEQLDLPGPLDDASA